MNVEKILGKVKLKHLDILVSEEPDIPSAMTNILGFTNNWFTRKINFLSKFKKAFIITQTLRNTDPQDIELTDKCPITYPANIDFITFQAMMELQAHLNQGIDLQSNPSMAIAKAIAIACFQHHYDLEKYESDSLKFNNFVDWILNQSYLHMFPLFNHITDMLTKSADMWNQRFFSVEIEDEDYEQAEGGRMSQFNVVNTLKSICSDFNVPFDDAWQISYNLVQTNSYSKATQNHVQDQMRRLKEIKMKSNRGNS